MKKIIYLTLIILCTSSLFAQKNLFLNNQTGCTLEYLFNTIDANCNINTLPSVTLLPNSINVIVTAPLGQYFHYVEITTPTSPCLAVALMAPSNIDSCEPCINYYSGILYYNINSSENINPGCACHENFTLSWVISSCNWGEIVVQ
ncbi:MAG: hypothetical protein JKY48_08445 [Flavobacteriales bacterium]|nr:hypothetical protein [Flavobacteriales bacterium]